MPDSFPMRILYFQELVHYSQNIEMWGKICNFMPFWEVVLDKDKVVLGRYNQEYFSEQKIGEIIKKLYEKEIRQGHNLTIKLSKTD